jgi:hypothetical protein
MIVNDNEFNLIQNFGVMKANRLNRKIHPVIVVVCSHTDGGTPAAKTTGKKAKTAKKPSPPKFANPADKTQTWSGKGRQPEWFKAAMAAGKSPEDLAI